MKKMRQAISARIGQTLLTAAIPMAAVLVGASGAQAATWNVDAAGNWNTGTNWNAAVPNAIGAQADLTFDISVARTVTLDVPVTLGTLNIGDSAGTATVYTLAGTATNKLTMDTSSGNAVIQQTATAGADIISAPITLNSNLDIYSSGPGKTLALNGTITTGGGNINIGVAGVTSGNPGYNAGTISISAANSQLAGNPNLTVNSGTFATGARSNTYGSLVVNSGTTASGSGFTMNTGGALTVNGTLTWSGSSVTSSAGMTIGSGAALNVGSTASLGLVLNGNVLFNGAGAGATINGNGGNRTIKLVGTRTFNVGDGTGAVDLTIGATTGSNLADIISGTAGDGLTKTGAGVMKLAANTNTFSYNGATTVSQGTLALANNSATVKNIIAASPTINIASGATLDVSGVSSNSFALASGQTVKATGSGIATIAGSLDAATNSGIIDLADFATVSTLKITSAGTALKLNGTALKFDLGATLGSNDTLVIRDAADSAASPVSTGLTGNVITISSLSTNTSLATGDYTLLTASSGLGTSDFSLASPTLTIGSNNYSLSLANSTSTAEILTVTIPEPAMGFAASIALGLLSLRRRRIA